MYRFVLAFSTITSLLAMACSNGPDCTEVCNNFTYCGPQTTMYDKCVMRCLSGFFESDCLACSDFGSATESACTDLRDCFNQNCLAWQVGIPAIADSVKQQACSNPPPTGTPNSKTQECGIWRELISMCAGDDSQAAAGEAECKDGYSSPECLDCLDLNNCTDLLACNVLNCRWTIMAGCSFE